MDAWRVEVSVREGLPDPAGEAARSALIGAGLPISGAVRSRRGFLLGRELTVDAVEKFAASVLADPITDEFVVHAPGATVPAEAGRVTIRPRLRMR